ncbi:hypothetical protein BACCOP_02910 [Phocaeicola coprocola DSM 17136]|uniref:Uncharacterized protein n=1 Tax=Phocaeicola coprocola DSM 17136 TaxID=470145 RepID=B3JLW2_9BACT|nr:hypothetical protein BACCOP_02910 [Phocaeicola coprocola DSM 17136]
MAKIVFLFCHLLRRKRTVWRCGLLFCRIVSVCIFRRIPVQHFR